MKHPAIVGSSLLVVLLAIPSWVSAQATRTVTGHVTAEGAGQPPAGVQVQAKGTNLGTLTDQQGNFTLTVPSTTTTLILTYIGYKTQEVPIQDHVEVTLQEEAIGLQGLVVTALGVEREKKTLGYSVEDVTGDQVSQVPKQNLVNALQGNVAGVHVTNAGVTGGSVRVVIRGASSLTGNNQPLFIVDGIPVDNSAPSDIGRHGGVDYGNTLQDLDPNNIASISVLKGPNAAALYGTRAANGAIVITTKTAKPGANLGITATSSLTFESPLKLPNYQNAYGQGLYNQFQYVDGFGGGTFDGTDESWGPALNGQLINQFTGANMPFLPYPNNVRDYFKTGATWNTNVAVSRATENSNIRLSVTDAQIQSMAPGYSIDRKSVALKGGAAVTDKLHASASMNYMAQDAHNRMGTGYYDDNIMQNFTWFGRQVDLNALRHYVCDGTEATACVPGLQYNWNYNYHDNPYWVQFVNQEADERDRVIGDISVDYQLNDWITVTGKIARDWYRWHQKNDTEVGTVGSWFGTQGGFTEDNVYRSETNYDLLVAATRQLTPSILMDVNAGANTRKNDYLDNGVDVTKLTVPGIFTIDNAGVTPATSDYISHKEVRSVFGSLSLNYKGWWNVDVTGRNDWSSTLPANNRSFFYPSVSTAFVFTDALGMNNSILSSGKVRASWTRVGNDTDPYQLIAALTARQPLGTAPMFSINDQLANANLKPEQTTAWEVGADLGFFDERLGFVVTYYDNVTSDQIMPVDVSPTSGYTSRVLNAGEIENKGVELILRATPVRMENGFRWDMTVNWAKNDSKVVKLYGDLQTLVLGTKRVSIEARPGRPYGVIMSRGPLRDDQGRIMLSSSGLPQRDPILQDYGPYSPDWSGGIQNRFSYGPWDLSVLVDGQHGGHIFSVSEGYGTYAGVLARTLKGRENSETDPGIVVKGVLPDGSINGDGVNDVSVTAQDYYHNTNAYWMIDDAGFLKLREVRLGYRLPTSLMNRLGFSSGDISLIGRNLLLRTRAENIDPETALDATNAQGVETGQFPTARSYGFSLSIRP